MPHTIADGQQVDMLGRFAGRRVGVVLSGGNVGVTRFRDLTENTIHPAS